MIRTSLIAAVVALFAGSASAQYMAEDFSSGVPPTGWSEGNNGNSAGWEDLGGIAWHDDYTGYNLNSLDSSAADLTGSSSAQLDWMNTNIYATWTLKNSVSVNGTEVWSQDSTNGASGLQVVDLSAYDGSASVSLSFLYEGDYANDWQVDDVVIDDAPAPPPPSHSVFSEDFESGVIPPAGWVENNNGNDVGWEPDPYHTLNGASSAWHDDDNGYNLNSLIAGGIDCSGETGLVLNWDQDNAYATWTARNSVNINGSEAWYQDGGGMGGVSSQSADLAAYDGSAGLEIEYLYEGDYANEWSIDDVDLRADDGGGGGGLSLSVSGLVAGGSATLTLDNAGPGAACLFAWSSAGGGPTSTVLGDCDLSQPINRLPSVTADSAGSASISAAVPAAAAGVSIWLQAADLSTGELSPSLAEVIG